MLQRLTGVQSVDRTSETLELTCEININEYLKTLSHVPTVKVIVHNM